MDIKDKDIDFRLDIARVVLETLRLNSILPNQECYTKSFECVSDSIMKFIEGSTPPSPALFNEFDNE